MDRKRELLRQYKDTAPKAGVYLITNRLTGRVFVGASMNLHGAMNRHRFELERGNHRNQALLSDWIHAGSAAFTFEPIDILAHRDDPAFDPEAELAIMLTLWCEEHDCFGEKGYNGASAGRRCASLG